MTEKMKPAGCPSSIPAHRASEISSEEGTSDTEKDSDDAPAWIAAGHEKFRDDADDGADNDGPEECGHKTGRL